MKMISYEDILRKIHVLENQKTRNEEKIRKFSEENILIGNRIKLLNQKKEQIEKIASDLSDIISSSNKNKETRENEN